MYIERNFNAVYLDSVAVVFYCIKLSMQLLAGLAELELWCDHAKEEDCPGMNLNTQGKLLDSWSRVLNSYTEYMHFILG
ncbi:hypothetical protein IMY05_010G0047200 [Salix suchowensis]|nr:hypothetical protein IMY05_010G0047200 [Salix suchowensis]